VQVPAVALERVLLDVRRPPLRHRRSGVLLDGQLVFHLAVEGDALLRRRADDADAADDADDRGGDGGERGNQDLDSLHRVQRSLTHTRQWSYLCGSRMLALG